MKAQKGYLAHFLKYICILVWLFPLIGFSDETKEDYINSCDIVFTARYAQAGKTKRYLVEDIFKGSVDKDIMNYVIVTAVQEEKRNPELLLFLIRTKPNFSIANSVVNAHGKVGILHGDASSNMSLEEIQGIIKRDIEKSTEEKAP